MIKVSMLVIAFEEIIGWPYVSPGTNDQNGIDCSGAFVRGYRKHGLSISHGSNSIFRKHCDAMGRIDGDTSRLHVGMAVFKQRTDGCEPDKYRGDGYGNMYHIGLVTSVNPLRIVHATPNFAKVDTSLGKGESAWDYYGWLTDVDYGQSAISSTNPEMDDGYETVYTPEPDEYETGNTQAGEPRIIISATVYAANGKPVKLRAKPSSTCDTYWPREVGTVLDVLEKGDTWCKVRSRSRIGYMMTDFLTFG